MTTDPKYRWECPRCRQHGRWLRDPHAAIDYGINHDNRRHLVGEGFVSRLIELAANGHQTRDRGTVA